MPIHDWAKAPSGLFHNFHQLWTGELCTALNAGNMPPGYYAMVESKVTGFEPDIIGLRTGNGFDTSAGGGTAVLTKPMKTHHHIEADEAISYTRRANRIAVRNRYDDVVAIVELVSPGNKSNKKRFEQFIDKLHYFFQSDIHILLLDLFPPTQRDPNGIHPEFWGEYGTDDFDLPADKPLTLAAYKAGPIQEAFIEPVAVGMELPAMPIFLEGDGYILAPLEATYAATWAKCPARFRQLVLEGAPEA